MKHRVSITNMRAALAHEVTGYVPTMNHRIGLRETRHSDAKLREDLIASRHVSNGTYQSIVGTWDARACKDDELN